MTFNLCRERNNTEINRTGERIKEQLAQEELCVPLVYPLGVGELQADEVQDFGPLVAGVILDELAELHLTVRLPRHVDHVDHLAAPWKPARATINTINNTNTMVGNAKGPRNGLMTISSEWDNHH